MSTYIASAPGRVNLIGGHTDYNEGYVFPIAIDRHVQVTARERQDRQIRIEAPNIGQFCEFNLDNDLRSTQSCPHHPHICFAAVIRGLAHLFQERGIALVGTQMDIIGNVPMQAGLGSSAALAVASALALKAVAIDSPNVVTCNDDMLEIAALCQQAENEFAEVDCGVMDHTISLFGNTGDGILIDCQNLHLNYTPLNLDDNHIVVCNSGIKRKLVDTEYNQRVKDCKTAVQILRQFIPNLTSLRDVTLTDLEGYSEWLPADVKKRSQHVIEENHRVQDALAALMTGDLAEFGRFMNASHASLRDNYEVSSPELDKLVDIAQSIDGVLGSRMTGAGFGGSTVSLMSSAALDTFRARVAAEYGPADIIICQPSDGATVKKT